jgi:hypothetical protein
MTEQVVATNCNGCRLVQIGREYADYSPLRFFSVSENADPLSTGHGSLLAAASNWADKNILPILRFAAGVSNWATDMSEYR